LGIGDWGLGPIIEKMKIQRLKKFNNIKIDFNKKFNFSLENFNNKKISLINTNTKNTFYFSFS